jgi:uncharacterized membrane protein
MTAHNDPNSEPPIFSAIITPHRSLGATGFAMLMLALVGISFVAGMVFVAAGAWPVMGFFGLDAALIYIAFRASYRSAAAYEQVIVSPTELTIRKVSARGAVREWKLNPLWVRLEREIDEDYGTQRLSLVSHGRILPIAGCLGPAERESFAIAFSAALGEARRGPARTAIG